MNGIDDRDKDSVGQREKYGDLLQIRKHAISNRLQAELTLPGKHRHRCHSQLGQSKHKPPEFPYVSIVKAIQSFKNGLPRAEQFATVRWLAEQHQPLLSFLFRVILLYNGRHRWLARSFPVILQVLPITLTMNDSIRYRYERLHQYGTYINKQAISDKKTSKTGVLIWTNFPYNAQQSTLVLVTSFPVTSL